MAGLTGVVVLLGALVLVVEGALLGAWAVVVGAGAFVAGVVFVAGGVAAEEVVLVRTGVGAATCEVLCCAGLLLLVALGALAEDLWTWELAVFGVEDFDVDGVVLVEAVVLLVMWVLDGTAGALGVLLEW